MNRRNVTGPRPRVLAVAALAIMFLLAQVSVAAALDPRVTQTNQPGFGDKHNSYAWSMQWFKGKLYVGTSRDTLCVERLTIQFYYPDSGAYVTHPDPDVTCPADPYDLDLRAEIWQYTPESGVWQRVFQSVNLPNPVAPGKFIARDIGFRGMTVLDDALYVSGVTAGEYIRYANGKPAVPAPRILRSTDGVTFSEIVHAGTVATAWTPTPEVYPMGFRSIVALQDRLFVTASVSLTGDGAVLELDPVSKAFTQVSPPTLRDFELEVFNNKLYAGVGDDRDGYSVWRTDASGTPPYTFTPIVTNGAGRGSFVTSVVSMRPFQGRLYVGSSGWYNGSLFPASELIRINPDDTWDLVVGNSRWTPQGFKFPISGLPDGFANPFNVHFWRMQEHNQALYLGTNDDSYLFRTIPWLDPFIRHEYGFDLFWSGDGWFWFLVTRDAFGNPQDFGARTLASSPQPDGGFVGSANHAQGTRVWRGPVASTTVRSTSRTGTWTTARLTAGPTATAALTAMQRSSTLAAPKRLEVELDAAAPVLSWEPSAGAARYRIFRATYQLNRDVGVTRPPTIPQLPPEARRLSIPRVPGNYSPPPDAWIPGALTAVGETTESFYKDVTAQQGVRYTYYVQAEDSQGLPSKPSNLVIVPSLAPPVTLDRVDTFVHNRMAHGKLTHAAAAPLLRLTGHARAALARGDLGATKQALADLHRRVAENQVRGLHRLDAEDLEIQVAKLVRRVSLAQRGLIAPNLER